MTNAVAVLDQVQQRLATITTVRDAKELRDQAAAISDYAKRARKGLRAQNAAARIKFLCERRGGELLRQVPTVQGQRDTTEEGLVATIKTSGLSLQTAYRWINLARMPEEELERAATLCDADGEELTTGLVYETIVRQWLEAHGAPTSAQRHATDGNPEFAKRDLLEWEILDAPDLVDLSPEIESVVVTEVRAAYDDFCEDVHRGKVTTESGWNPAIIIDRRCLRTHTRKVLLELRTGDLPLAKVRHRLRGFLDNAVRRMERRATDPTALGKRTPKSTGPRPKRILSPLEQYVRRAKRFLAETLGMAQPYGLLETRIDLPHDVLDPLVTKLCTALHALVAKQE